MDGAGHTSGVTRRSRSMPMPPRSRAPTASSPTSGLVSTESTSSSSPRRSSDALAQVARFSSSLRSARWSVADTAWSKSWTTSSNTSTAHWASGANRIG